MCSAAAAAPNRMRNGAALSTHCATSAAVAAAEPSAVAKVFKISTRAMSDGDAGQLVGVVS